MRYPTHIILDINKPISSNTTSSWTISYKNFISKNQSFVPTLTTLSNLKISNKSILNTTYSTTNIKTSSPILLAKNQPARKSNSLLWSLFDINFLKKEKMYTKLKYSRSPQYDIVSGGVAALFSGFLGFLISEKFGIELVDSGDFYTFFMYIVFICFSLRPFIKILSKHDTVYHFFSLKFFLNYLYTLFILLSKNMSSFLINNDLINTVFNFLIKNEFFSTIFKKIIKAVQFFKNYPLNK